MSESPDDERDSNGLVGMVDAVDSLIEDYIHLFTVIGIFGAVSLYLGRLGGQSDLEFTFEGWVYLAVFLIVSTALVVLIVRIFQRAELVPRTLADVALLFFASLLVILLVSIGRLTFQFQDPLLTYLEIGSIVGSGIALLSLTAILFEYIENNLEDRTFYTEFRSLTVIISLIYVFLELIEQYVEIEHQAALFASRNELNVDFLLYLIHGNATIYGQFALSSLVLAISVVIMELLEEIYSKRGVVIDKLSSD